MPFRCGTPTPLSPWREQIRIYPALAVAIETNQGAAVEQLLLSPVTVYPINPRSAQAYRQRKTPTSNKTDRLDARCLADALRVDGQNWRPSQPLDPIIQELRLLCRDELHLIGQRTELVNQLQQALSEYDPELHTRNQPQHGSWVLQLIQQETGE